MQNNSRFEKDNLLILRVLKKRKNIAYKEKASLSRLEKGFIGERMFDDWVDKLTKKWTVLKDLQIKSNNSIFQIDSMIITQESILLFEVKNYEGDYYIEDEKWYRVNGSEIQNPLLQLKRSESLLRILLQNLGYTVPIQAFLVFINPTFHLYHATRNPHIIFPTQLDRFFTTN
ncbi:NERD domain-containing protein [Bacillus sp. FJAT-49711]|uniref:nuclease-related domain-containing protein n=1 Tax=Bacillus sp. FJAT-49711 TaxID=2833585 RepID=UPI001BC91343|nr:nuclease-related domain-containing protein [Bacillus sp. FJAT-49711]MBS4218220.1 NERD domain-containing protein [Bacillus sp. FJAT-49711]